MFDKAFFENYQSVENERKKTRGKLFPVARLHTEFGTYEVESFGAMTDAAVGFSVAAKPGGGVTTALFVRYESIFGVEITIQGEGKASEKSLEIGQVVGAFRPARRM
jgi:hypothetical protein